MDNSTLDALAAKAAEFSEEIRMPFETFIANMKSVNHIACFPYAINIKNKIKAHQYQIVRHYEEVTPQSLFSNRDDWVSAIKEKVSQHVSSNEGILDEELEKILREVSSEVLSFYDPQTTETVARDIRFQSTVSMWSCLEVLLRNYINANLNNNPDLIELILKNEKLKKEIGLDRIEISNLIEYNFDLRNNIGDLIFKHHNSKKIGNLQNLIEITNPNLKAVSQLNNGRLKTLNLKRNLITHHRGICDSEYKEKSNSTIEIGQQIDVTPGSLVNFYREVSQFALDLANSIDHRNVQ